MRSIAQPSEEEDSVVQGLCLWPTLARWKPGGPCIPLRSHSPDSPLPPPNSSSWPSECKSITRILAAHLSSSDPEKRKKKRFASRLRPPLALPLALPLPLALAKRRKEKKNEGGKTGVELSAEQKPRRWDFSPSIRPPRSRFAPAPGNAGLARFGPWRRRQKPGLYRLSIQFNSIQLSSKAFGVRLCACAPAQMQSRIEKRSSVGANSSLACL